VVIEHHLDIIKVADWIIDLGPEGGEGGGTIVAQGTPEDIVRVPASKTGQFLLPHLQQGHELTRTADAGANGRKRKKAR
jgi:excinuclease ABC subunit A